MHPWEVFDVNKHIIQRVIGHSETDGSGYEPGDTQLLKLIAIISMTIDHVHIAFFPDNNLMAFLGRFAFPIYAYCVAVGSVYTRDRLKYLGRLVFIGLLSQPFYIVALNHDNADMYAIPFRSSPLQSALNYYLQSWDIGNIMLLLALGVLLIWAIREKKAVFVVALAIIAWRLEGHVAYGWHGVLLIVLFYLTLSRWWLCFPVMFAYLYVWGYDSTLAEYYPWWAFPLFVLALLALVCARTHSGIRINKWVFYWFYPAHLCIIMILKMIMGV